MAIKKSASSERFVRLMLLLAVFVAGIVCMQQGPGLEFDRGMVFSLLTALAISGQFVLVIIAILRRVSEQRRQLLSDLLIKGGVLLVVLGMLSGCLLVLVIYMGAPGVGTLSFIASLLVMLGLNLGIPLLSTVIYENGYQRRLKLAYQIKNTNTKAD